MTTRLTGEKVLLALPVTVQEWDTTASDSPDEEQSEILYGFCGEHNELAQMFPADQSWGCMYELLVEEHTHGAHDVELFDSCRPHVQDVSSWMSSNGVTKIQLAEHEESSL